MPTERVWVDTYEQLEHRLAAHRMLVRLGLSSDDHNYDLLEKLLGAKDIFKLNERQRQTLALLAGPHGEVYYRVLRARKGKSE